MQWAGEACRGLKLPWRGSRKLRGFDGGAAVSGGTGATASCCQSPFRYARTLRSGSVTHSDTSEIEGESEKKKNPTGARVRLHAAEEAGCHLSRRGWGLWVCSTEGPAEAASHWIDAPLAALMRPAPSQLIMAFRAGGTCTTFYILYI